MKLANYSTTVEVEKTITEIQHMLAAHGAKAVRIDYENEEPSGLSFLINTPKGDLAFRLPVRIDKVAHVLSTTRIRKRYRYDVHGENEQQASRVAWRIIRDWVRAQLAFIETEMVTLDQVFLPYMTVGKTSISFYEFMQNRLLALSEGKREE